MKVESYSLPRPTRVTLIERENLTFIVVTSTAHSGILFSLISFDSLSTFVSYSLRMQVHIRNHLAVVKIRARVV